MQGTILPGVTRKSVIQLAQQLGYEVQETPVSITEAMAADEIFTTGTAVVVSAVGSLTYQVGDRLSRAHGFFPALHITRHCESARAHCWHGYGSVCVVGCLE